MIKLKFLLIIILLTLTAGCTGSAPSTGDSNSQPSEKKHLVTRAEFVSLEEKQISPPFSSEVMFLFPEGATASQGQEIAQLSPGKRIEQLREQSLDLELYRLALEREQKLLEMNDRLAEKNNALSQLELEVKEIEHARTVELRDWLRILELKESARAESVRAKMLQQQLEAGTSMAARGFVSRQELVDTKKELDLLTINASLTSALIPYIKETPNEKNLFKATQELEKARLKYQVASFSIARSAADYRYNLNEAVRGYGQVASRAKELESQIASLSIQSPVGGVVIYGQTFDGANYAKVKAGVQVFPGIFFLSVVNPARSGIVFAFDQRDAVAVASTTSFYFRPDSLPEKLVEAQLETVIPVALEIPNGRPEGRTQVAYKAVIASYPADFRLGYSGTVYAYDFVADLLRRFAGNRTFSVSRRPVKRLMSTTGDVVTASAASILTGISEGKLNRIEDEGKSVQKGEVIAVIGCEELVQTAKDTEIELKKKGEEYQLQLKKNDIDKEKLSRGLEVRKGALEVARLKHAALLKGRDEDKIIDLQRGLELIEARIGLAEEKIRHTNELRKKGLSSELDLLKAQAELAGLKKDRAISAEKLETEESGPTRRSVRLSELDVRRAELELEKARVEVDMNSFSNLMAGETLRATISKLEVTLEGYNKQINNATIKSPADGVIIHNEFYKQSGGLGKAKVGDVLHQRIPFMQIADVHNLQVKTTVSEMDVKFLKPGDEVKLMLKGNSVRSFPGWINSVGIVATTEIEKRQDAVVPVLIDLLAPEKGIKTVDPAFRPGNTCEVEFKLYDLPDALHIPYDALVPMATATCVVTADRKLQPVELIFSDGLRGCAVASGISEGDTILLLEPEHD